VPAAAAPGRGQAGQAGRGGGRDQPEVGDGLGRLLAAQAQDQADQPQQGQDRDAGALEEEAALSRQERSIMSRP
jgi:hypothetical protein